jgi:hypothetical protein
VRGSKRSGGWSEYGKHRQTAWLIAVDGVDTRVVRGN